jgi:hypothetical protein
MSEMIPSRANKNNGPIDDEDAERKKIWLSFLMKNLQALTHGRLVAWSQDFCMRKNDRHWTRIRGRLEQCSGP